jgi:hypothetical protein
MQREKVWKYCQCSGETPAQREPSIEPAQMHGGGAITDDFAFNLGNETD